MKIVFLIGRILVGLFYIYNGVNHFIKFNDMVGYADSKGVPMAGFAVAGTGLLLLLAGVLLILGIMPELAVVCLVLFFVPVTFMMHNFWAVGEEMRTMELVNFSKNMALLGSALMFLMIPKPWPYGLKSGGK